jgi:hypothetical protein
LKYENLSQAIASEATVLVLAPALGGPITGVIAFGALYGADKFGLFHITRLDTESFGFLSDLCYFHCP